MVGAGRRSDPRVAPGAFPDPPPRGWDEHRFSSQQMRVRLALSHLTLVSVLCVSTISIDETRLLVEAINVTTLGSRTV